MAGRSLGSHQSHIREFSFAARLRRGQLLRTDDRAETAEPKAMADRVAVTRLIRLCRMGVSRLQLPADQLRDAGKPARSSA
jgi:hypothetical protein